MIASSEPVAPAAWIGDCRLESWHQTDGTVRHLATYNLESTGCNRLRLAMPPEIARERVARRADRRRPAAWQIEERLPVARRVPKTDGTRRVPYCCRWSFRPIENRCA